MWPWKPEVMHRHPVKNRLRAPARKSQQTKLMGIEIKDGRIFVEGKETVNPELIGWAIIDAAESNEIEIICKSLADDKV